MTTSSKIAIVGHDGRTEFSYENRLAAALSALPGSDVTFIALEHKLLKDKYDLVRPKVRTYLNELAEKLSQYDAVNVHVTPKRFGPNVLASQKNLLTLVSASRRVLLTIHDSPPEGLSFKKEVLNLFDQNIGGARAIVKALAKTLFSKNHAQILWDGIASRQRQNAAIKILTFNRLLLHRWQRLYGISQSDVQPMTLLTKAEQKQYQAPEAIAAIRDRLGYTNQDIVIGTFGYFNKHSGIETLIRAFAKLPPEYKLLVYGNFEYEPTHSWNLRQSHIDEINAVVDKKPAQDGKIFSGNRILTDLAAFSSLPLSMRSSSLGNLSLKDLQEVFSRQEYVVRLMDVFKEAFPDPKDLYRIKFALPMKPEDHFSAMAICDVAAFAESETGSLTDGFVGAAAQLSNNVFVTYTPMHLEMKRAGCEGLTMFDAGNPNEFAQKILRLKQGVVNPDLVKFRETSSMDVMAEKIAETLRSLIAKS